MIALSWSDSFASIAAIALVEGARQVLVERDGAGERLLDQVLHQILRLVGRGLLGRGDDLIEEG